MGNAYQVGTQFMVERGSGKFPPEPDNPNHYWELSQQTDYERVFTLRSTEPSHTVQDLRTHETLRDENDKLLLVVEDRDRRIKIQSENLKLQQKELGFMAEKISTLERDNYKINRDFDEMRQGGLEQNRKLQEQADKFRAMYHEQAAENKKLKAIMTELKSVDTEKCEESPVNPDWVETDNLHKERMRLENESIMWNNRRIEAELKGSLDYPPAVYERLHSKVEELASNLLNRVAGLWVAVVALAINEVIQWVTR